MELLQFTQINKTQIHKIQRKTLEMLIKKIEDTSGLITTTVSNKRVSEVENKTPNTTSKGKIFEKNSSFHVKWRTTEKA